MRRETRQALIEDGAVLLLALAVRIAYGLTIRSDPLFDFPEVDARLFWEEGARIARGAGAPAVFYKPPLFGHLLAGAASLGLGPAGARWALLLLSSLAAPLTARLGRPLIGRAGAILAGIFAALYAPAIFYGAELLPATTVLLLNAVLLLVVAAADERGSPAAFVAAGILLGLSALARPTILVFLPLLLSFFRRVPGRAALLAAAALLTILPAAIHNARGGDFVPVSSNGGINFYFGNHAGADGRSAVAPELPSEPGEAERAARSLAERAEGRTLRPSEISSFWYRRGLAWMASDPGGAAVLFGKKLYAALNDRDGSDNIDLRAVEEISLPLRAAPFRFGLLFALALPGLVPLSRSRRGRMLLLYGASVLAPMVLFFVVGRFRLPLAPALAVAASAGLLAVARALRRGPRAAALPVLLVLAGLLFSRSALFGVDEDRTWHYYYLRGDALFRKGDAGAGLAAFEEAYRRNEGVALTRNALAFVYAETGRELPLAERLARGAIDLEPGRRRFYLDTLGWVLYREGRFEEAAAAFGEAIPLFAPDEAASKAEALGHLAAVRDAEGRPAEADSLRREAARVAGGEVFR